MDNSFHRRLTREINNYLSQRIEISEGVFFSQYQTIKRIMKFKNRDLSGSKITEDLRYDYHFDIISPRVDSEVRNMRFDTKDIVIFSQNPTGDFPVVFIANAKLKEWMMNNGEDDKLKDVVEEFSSNGNILFKKVKGGYETTDPLNTYVTNQKAKDINDTALVERHEMTASDLTAMTGWDHVNDVIENSANITFFTATANTSTIDTAIKHYEIYEYTGEISEKEFNALKNIKDGDENKFFLAKVIVAGLTKSNTTEKYTMFAEKLKGTMADWYMDAHRGRYEGRFWRVGIYELLFDHQIRANEIANDIAAGLEWASKVIFKTSDASILQNIRADMDNGDVIRHSQNGEIMQLDVRLHNLDQLIADWNRVLQDADTLSNSTTIVRGEGAPSGMPFRSLSLMNDNATATYMSLRQKLTLPYRRVFREWILPPFLQHLKGEDIFRLTGDDAMVDRFRQVIVNSWYLQNLVKIGYHTQDVAEQIKAEKLKELEDLDPTLKNSPEVWKNVHPRLFVTIKGDKSDASEDTHDIMVFLTLEDDPNRRNWLLDRAYAISGMPIPPKQLTQPPPQSAIDPATGQPIQQGQQPQSTNGQNPRLQQRQQSRQQQQNASPSQPQLPAKTTSVGAAPIR